MNFMGDKNSEQRNYFCFWRKEVIEVPDDFSVFCISGKLKVNGYPENWGRKFEGRGIDSYGGFNVTGDISDKQGKILLNKTYSPEIRGGLKNLVFELEKVDENYFTGIWSGRDSEGTTLHGRAVMTPENYLDVALLIGVSKKKNLEQELLGAYLSLLGRKIKDARKEFPFSPTI